MEVVSLLDKEDEEEEVAVATASENDDASDSSSKSSSSSSSSRSSSSSSSRSSSSSSSSSSSPIELPKLFDEWDEPLVTPRDVRRRPRLLVLLVGAAFRAGAQHSKHVSIAADARAEQRAALASVRRHVVDVLRDEWRLRFVVAVTCAASQRRALTRLLDDVGLSPYALLTFSALTHTQTRSMLRSLRAAVAAVAQTPTGDDPPLPAPTAATLALRIDCLFKRPLPNCCPPDETRVLALAATNHTALYGLTRTRHGYPRLNDVLFFIPARRMTSFDRVVAMMANDTKGRFDYFHDLLDFFVKFGDEAAKVAKANDNNSGDDSDDDDDDDDDDEHQPWRREFGFMLPDQFIDSNTAKQFNPYYRIIGRHEKSAIDDEQLRSLSRSERRRARRHARGKDGR